MSAFGGRRCALDRAVDVDLARAAVIGESSDWSRLIEHLRRAELDDPVDGVRDEAGHEDGEGRPVEALAAAGEVGQADDEEEEVEDELDHPLRPLRQRLLRPRLKKPTR